jgi:hypothetical protein
MNWCPKWWVEIKWPKGSLGSDLICLKDIKTGDYKWILKKVHIPLSNYHSIVNIPLNN